MDKKFRFFDFVSLKISSISISRERTMSTTPRKLNEARRLSNELNSSIIDSEDEESSTKINQSYSIFWKSAFTHTNGFVRFVRIVD